MKKLLYILGGAAMVLSAGSCKKFFDINEDPNRVITNSPELVLPQAIVGATHITSTDYNTMGADLMYRANAGGFSGFGTVISYDYTNGSHTAQWANMYDNLNDFKYVKDKTAGDPKYVYYNAVARIMMAHDWQLLVDTYNDIPYTEALQGAENISPKYDKAENIYKDIAAQIDTAINLINSGLANPLTTLALTKESDPLFSQSGPNMTLWKQFANTLKLRMIVRAGNKVQWNNTNFSSDGFLTTDAMVNPGYVKVAGKQNPIWPYSVTNTASASSRLPSYFSLSFYDGTKINDPKRGAVTFRTFPGTQANQLGNETNPTPPNSPVPHNWFKGTNGTTYEKAGIYKGFDAPLPIMLGAESYLLQAEAMVRGLIPGDPATAFNKAIEASFIYLYRDNTGNVPGSGAYSKPVDDATAYRTLNNTNPLVNFALATTDEEKIEAIITQKYVALTMIHSHEAWNEYRRTGYPRVTGSGPTQTMASTVSMSTRPDRMPTRVLYPTSEFNTNKENVPKDINKFGSLIFWAK
ncbi:MAG TPA: SusD/RagB family nutrient-binding outer membrane lipoprotein [Chitinophagaceae bacterium]|nr:SusD/RagB family nutrient-binding outer membrane lipoprotein [Chitinophagaceae bacterium]